MHTSAATNPNQMHLIVSIAGELAKNMSSQPFAGKIASRYAKIVKKAVLSRIESDYRRDSLVRIYIGLNCPFLDWKDLN